MKVIHVWSPLGSPSVADGSHRVPSVVGLTLHAAVSLADRNEVPWQTSAPPLSARVAPGDLFDAYCVIAQRPAPDTIIHVPGQPVVMRLRVVARPAR